MIDTLIDNELVALSGELAVREKVLCETDYYNFVRRVWLETESETPFIDNWHIKYICDILQDEIERIAAGRKKTKDIIINVPPRSAKSKLCTIMLCPWTWTRYPWMKFINNSFSSDLSTKHCMDSRRIIELDWYKRYWGDVFYFTSDLNTRSWFDNNKGGMRKATSTGAMITGIGADVITNDDPQNPEMAESEADRLTVRRHSGQTLYSRLNNQETGLRLLIQQRLHEEDLTGYQLANSKNKYFHICIPAEETEDVKPIELRKFYKDGLFFPARFSRETLEDAKQATNLGAYGYAGQMLQRPSPLEGGMFKKANWRYWQFKGMNLPPVVVQTDKGPVSIAPIDLPDRFDEKIGSWDMAFKGTEGSDNVSGQVWSKIGANKFLLKEDTGKKDYPTTVRAVRAQKVDNADMTCILIEEKANGPAVIADLSNDIPGIVPSKADVSTGGKVARAMPMVRQQEAGNIYLPHPATCKWVDEYINEFTNFPNGKHDDRVDCAAQAIVKLSDTKHMVITTYNQHEKNHHRPFDIHWQKLLPTAKLYASLWQKADMQTGEILCLWDAEVSHLYVFADYVHGDAQATTILGQTNEILKPLYGGNKFPLANFTWFGNDAIVGKPGHDAVGDEYMKYGIYVQDNDMYEDFAAIVHTQIMFKQGNITIHTRCVDLNAQLNGWLIKDGKPASLGIKADADNSLVLALCNVSNMLVTQKKVVMPTLKPYTKEKTIYVDGLQKDEEEKPASGNSWMSI